MNRSKWMWKYGEYEIYHSMLLHSRRQAYGVDYPSMWPVDAPAPWVEFKTTFSNESSGYLRLTAVGTGYVLIDEDRHGTDEKVEIKPGEHQVVVRITNTNGLVCAYVESDVCPSGEGWYTESLPKQLHAKKEKQPVGCIPEYFDVHVTPEIFPFEYKRYEPVSKKEVNGGMLYDFGHETFGKLGIENCTTEEIGVYYGESDVEALDVRDTVLWEILRGKTGYYLRSRAFRYIFIKGSNTENIRVYYDYEYLPLEEKGSFFCNDPVLNDIWKVSAHTLHLNSREFYLDGIKRDRWVWSGDAFQSYMINNYIHFDKDIVRRTILALRGKDPVEQHINLITDYSFYWIISIMNYYKSYGDLEFLKYIYPRMQSLMTFCETRLNQDGFVEGAEGDWVFIDWSDIDKDGAVCAEQILMYAAYRALADVAKLIGMPCEEYVGKSEKIFADINAYYWNEEKGAFIDSYSSGKNHVTRHANIFALMFDFATEEQKQSIIDNVLLNDAVTQITTPYFKFFEMDVLCKIGRLEYVTGAVRDYWGEMLKLGATSIWEEYIPELEGAEHYGMYGEKFGKSLCHAWGAGPIYLFGRYYLGVYATSAAYQTFRVEPNLGGLDSIEGKVPVNGGTVFVKADKTSVTVKSDVAGGTLIWKGKEYEIRPDVEVNITE